MAEVSGLWCGRGCLLASNVNFSSNQTQLSEHDVATDSKDGADSKEERSLTAKTSQRKVRARSPSDDAQV